MKQRKTELMTKEEIQIQADLLKDLPVAQDQAEETKAGAGSYVRGHYELMLDGFSPSSN